MFRMMREQPGPRINRLLSSRGFTISETVISIALLGIMVAGGASLYFNTTRIKALAMHKKVAIEIVNSRIEELRAIDYDTFRAEHPLSESGVVQNDDPEAPEPPLFVGYLPVTRELTVTYVPEQAVPDYLEVRASVTWQETNELGEDRTVDATTIFAP